MRLRSIFVAVLTGMLLVGSVWAGAVLSPIPSLDEGPAGGARPAANRVLSEDGDDAAVALGSCTELAADEACVGAAKISLEPQPPTPEAWVHGQENREECATLSESALDDPSATMMHAADWEHTPWIENTGCIYMGGYGIGPMNPVLEWDTQYGMWVRSAVFSDAEGHTLSLTIIDAEGYFGDYDSMCDPDADGCGAFAIAEAMGEELGVSPDGFIIASTHSHTSLDLIGGWGGVPDWYMDQVTTAIKDSIRQAHAARVPSTLEAGEELARRWNSERRDLYWSAEDPTVNWIRAIDRTGAVVTTVATFATHPVSFDEGLGIGHGDFPPVFAAQAEENQGGGVAMVFQAGLGNMTGGGNWEPKGKGIANVIPAAGGGTPIDAPDVKVARRFWDQPVTNGPLGGLGGAGFFDRPFGGPAAVDTGKADVNRCRSASPVSVHVNVVAARIGPVVVTSAPGEIFANYTNTIEERSSLTALAIGQANDALGYMPQSIEANPIAQQGTGFVAADHVGYEDAYMIDRCFGDMALETTLDLLAGL